MRLIIQRVNTAQVSVEGKVVGKINHGLFILVGIRQKDTEKDVEILSEKIAKLRIMSDKTGKMNLSICEVGKEILVVSQFTLYADTSGGNRPSFIKAGEPKMAEKLYQMFTRKLKDKRLKVETGSFGKYMQIDCELDGPVTISLASEEI